jgi:HEXXH motif-containing protein
MSMASSYPPVSMVSAPGDPSMSAAGLGDHWFTWEPSAGVVAALAKTWRRFWQTQSRMALEAAAEGVNQDLLGLLKRVEQLDLGRRLSPRMVARLAALMDAMTHEDGYAVYDTLQAWIHDKPEQWYSDGCVLESVATQDWEAPLLREIRNTQVAGVAGLEVFPLLEEDLSPYQEALVQALDLIRQVDEEMHAEIQTHVGIVKLFGGRGIEGLSTPKAFGAIWLKAPGHENALAWFLEHLVHECSHLHLNALMAFDPLLQNPNEINRSPIRPDPRPMFQVLHATFVLSRNKRVHARLHAQFPELNLGGALQEFNTQFEAGLAVLKEFMKPTRYGKTLLDSLSSN